MPNLRRIGFCLLLFALLAGLGGCVSTYDAQAALRQGGWQKVMNDTRDLGDFPQRDRTLILNYRAHSKMALGYFDSARNDYLRAWNIMNESEGGGVGAAMFISESKKWWMGDPYERAFNSFYLGMLYFEKGDRESAMACFHNAMAVDTGDLKAGEYIDDWLPPMIMRVRCYLGRGDKAGAKQILKQINALDRDIANFDPACPWLNIDAQVDANTVMMIELGQGPYMTTAGHYGSKRVINQGEYAESSARVWVDGEPLGEAYKIGDTFFQAITRGGRVMDDILKGKAIAKTAGIVTGAAAMHVGRKLMESGASKDSNGSVVAGGIVLGVGAAVLLASLLMNASADTRCDTLLPGETHLMMAKLPPGEHTVEVRYYDSRGSELRDMRQTGIPLHVPKLGDAPLLVRSQPRYYVPDSDAIRGEDPYASVRK